MAPEKGCRDLRLWIGLSALSVVLLLIAGGCGKKAPPVPPRVFAPQAAIFLKCIPGEEQILLKWKVGEGAVKHIRGFTVLQAASPLEGKDCLGCPLIFQSVGTVRADKRENQEYSFRIPVKPGFSYTFKIRSRGDARELFTDSENITCKAGMK